MDVKAISQTQRIVVNPSTMSVSVINAGPPGPAGPQGLPGASTVFPFTPILLTYDVTWPDADVPDTTPVIWVQPNAGGSAPPAGGRPGREPGDLVFIKQP